MQPDGFLSTGPCSFVLRGSTDATVLQLLSTGVVFPSGRASDGARSALLEPQRFTANGDYEFVRGSATVARMQTAGFEVTQLVLNNLVTSPVPTTISPTALQTYGDFELRHRSAATGLYTAALTLHDGLVNVPSIT